MLRTRPLRRLWIDLSLELAVSQGDGDDELSQWPLLRGGEKGSVGWATCVARMIQDLPLCLYDPPRRNEEPILGGYALSRGLDMDGRCGLQDGRHGHPLSSLISASLASRTYRSQARSDPPIPEPRS